MIGLTFFLQDNQKHPNRCEILLESYCDYTSSGHEAEQIVVAVLKAIRLEQSVRVVRRGSRTTVKGELRLYSAAAIGGNGNQ
jgi:citrate lyase alpha subunit